MTQYLLAGDGRRLTTGGGVPLTADAPGDAGTPIVAAAMPMTMTGSATVSALVSVSASLAMTFGLTASPSLRGSVAPMGTTFALTASPSAFANLHASAGMVFGLSASPTATVAVAAAPMPTTLTLTASPSALTTVTAVPAPMPTAFGLSAAPSQSAILPPVTLGTVFGLSARPSLDYGDLLRPPRAPRPVLLLTIGAEPLPVVTPIIPVTSTQTVDGHIAAPLAPPSGLNVVATVDAAHLEWLANGVPGSEYVIEDAPDSAGTPGAFTERAVTPNLRYTLAVDGTRWIRVRARLNGRTSAPSAAALVTRIDSGQITVSATKITQVEAKLDAKTTTFAQSTPPPSTGRVVGDTWINTADGNRINTWNGGGWVLRQLPEGVKTHYQSTAPLGINVGDLWYNSADDNRLYRFNGGSWQLVEDQRIPQTASAVQTLDARVTTTETGLTTYRASYTVKLDVNGYATGFVSVNTGTTSAFLISADMFRVIKPGGGDALTWDAGVLTALKGTHSVKLGAGFGTSNDLIFWYGADGSTGTRTVENAKFAITKDGLRKLGSTQVNFGSGWTSGAAITYSATPTSATISVTAGTFAMGSQQVSYNASSVNVSGSASTSAMFWLYYDDPGLTGGSKTLVASTSVVDTYNSDSRVLVGSVTVAFPASGSSGGGGSGGYEPECVDYDAVLPDGRLVRELRVGDMVECVDVRTGERGMFPLLAQGFGWADCYRVTTAHGEVIQSDTTPMDMPDGSVVRTPELGGQPVLQREHGWETAAIEYVGPRRVCKPDLGDRMFFAGTSADRCIATHNIRWKPNP